MYLPITSCVNLINGTNFFGILTEYNLNFFLRETLYAHILAIIIAILYTYLCVNN